MSPIGIVSDSTAGLAPEYIRQHRIRIVPLYIEMEGKTYRDGIDITPEEFYARLPHCDPLPVTSQPSVGDFLQVYQELAQEGVEGIISVHLSAEISGTINSAHLAAEKLGDPPVRIVDTRCAAGAHILTIEAIVQALERGADLDEAVAAAQAVIEGQKTLFVVDTLEYLYKGGRIGGAAAFLGSLLQFKPLLYFKDGRIDGLERVRTSSRALRRMVEIMRDWLGDEPVQAVVMEAACPDKAQTLRELLPQYLQIVKLRTTAISPVLGAHTGNGTLGLCCCPISICQPE